MTLNGKGLHLIRFFESCSLTGYVDAAGKPTIGWGHLVLPAEAEKYGPGRTITQEQANELLAYDLKRTIDGVRQVVQVELGTNAFSALVSFAFNLGVRALAGSRLLRLLHAGDFHGAAREFELWDNARDPKTGTLRELKGLVSRRKCEQFLFTMPEGA